MGLLSTNPTPQYVHFSAHNDMTPHTRKKVLFLITKSNWGGAQRYIFDLATHLNPDHFEPVVALGGSGKLSEKLQENGIRVIKVEHFSRDISLLQEMHVAIELWRIFRLEKPDVLHINSSKAGGLGALLGRVAGIKKIIFTAHGWAFNEDRPWLARQIIKLLHGLTVLLAHETIAVSNTLKSQLDLPFVGRKMTVIHNGRTIPSLVVRDDARKHIITHAPHLAKYADDFWSATIGELHKVKQHDVMIRALPRVVASYPHTRHVIISDGDERASLEALVHKLGLEAYVFFTGSILEASQYLKAFDLFVLPSRSEAFAYVVIEACIAELPIIASNVGGIPEILTDKHSGLLCAQGDIDGFGEAYLQLRSDQARREMLAHNAQKRATDFTFEQMLAKTIALYDSTNSRAT